MQALVKACEAGGILAGLYQPVLVFSNQSQAQGLTWAKQYGLNHLSFDNSGLKRLDYDAKVLELIAPHRLDCIALAGYMRILSPKFIQAYQGRIFNIHPADTRLHQGLGAYAWAWEQGLSQTLITVHQVSEVLDLGPIILQAPVDLRGLGSLEEVEQKGLSVEHELYPQALAKVYKEEETRA